MRIFLLEVEQNAEGSKLAYLSPLDADGKKRSGYRIAGPKAWGGSKSIAKLKISDDDLVSFIKSYAPEIISRLNP